MTITLTAETEARLRAKTQRDGGDINALAEHLILSALDWEAQERDETIAAIQRSEQAAVLGRERPLAAFISDQRNKHGFPANWPDDMTEVQDAGDARQ
jgi:hypothetical protein